MKKLFYVLTLFMSLGMNNIKADNVLAIDNLTATKGEQVVLPVQLNNTDPVCAFSFDLYLPDGVSVAVNSEDELDCELLRTTKHMFFGNYKDGYYTLAAMSGTSKTFSGNSGAVCNIRLEVSSSIATGNKTIQIKNIELTNPDNTSYRPANISCTLTVTASSAGGSYNIVDGTAYTNAVQQQYDELTYTRNISASQVGKWQAIYVPMSIDIADNADNFDIAEIYAVCPLKDTNGDNEIDTRDNDMLVFNFVTNGTTSPNTPYVFRPKTSGTMVVNSADNILYAAKEGTIFIATSKNSYLFRGLNESFTAVANDNNYYMSGGALGYRVTGSTNISPNRWVMHRTPKNYGQNTSNDNSAKDMELVVIGDDVDEIDVVRAMSNASDKMYTIDGRRVTKQNLRPGLYIMNNKKVFIK